MSTTPIFDQLCQELGDVIGPKAYAEAIDIGPDEVAEREPQPIPKETVVEWSAPEECWDRVHRFDELAADGNER